LFLPANKKAWSFLFLNLLLLSSACAAKVITTTFESTYIAISNEPGLIHWQQQNPEYRLEISVMGDLDGDARQDLIIIYQAEKGKYQMVAILDHSDGYYVTEPVSAPVSDQVITIFDMDQKSPLEVLVSGRKGAFIGSAVFRLEKSVFEVLFSTGYGDCC
jgi:hypothetical protein